MLSFAFMRRAFLVGILLAISIPMIGIIMINRKTSMIADALSHTSLAGVGLGLIFGYEPLIFAIIFSILAAFLIEYIRNKFPQYGDMATAIIMSFGLGLAAVFSDFAKGGASFESYLFGSITTLSESDLLIVGVVSLLVIGVSLYLYRPLLYLSINPTLARLAGIDTGKVNGIFTLLTAVTVAIASKMVGALMITSLMVIPVASALIFSSSYKKTYLASICYGVFDVVVGISLSYYLGLKPGGAIVLVAIASLGLTGLLVHLKRKVRKGPSEKNK